VPEVRVPSASTGWLNIAGDGSVTIASPSDEGGDQGPVVGRIVPVCFPNESALERLPSGLLVETADSGSAFEAVGAILKQGYLESSTVDPAREQAAAEELLRFADQLESNQ
jgi:flagellar basal body rod protein FlgG